MSDAAARAQQPDPKNYRTIPALKEYIERIGAEQINFRRFVVSERRGGYKADRITIKVEPDGTITVWAKEKGTTKDFEPTEVEQAAIKAAFVGLDFPTSIAATNAQVKELRLRLGAILNENFFVLLDVGSDAAIMCQHRIEDDDGKRYAPWTMWSDGEWRMMEPDGLLPLWRPTKKRHTYIMLHEGAKTACLVDRLCYSDDAEAKDARAKHPWAAELKGYDHWGWIGGAPNPHRTDWAKLPAGDVVLALDNDQIGTDAASTISRTLKQRRLGAILFDDKFPKHFDLAEPWPRIEKWWKGERYVGPSLDQMLKPATWATDVLPNPAGKGRPIIKIRPTFVEEWLVSIEPSVFVHRWYCDRHLSPEQFNALVRPFSDTHDTARLMTPIFSSQVDSLTYQPFKRQSGRHVAEVETIEGRRLVNTYRPPDVKPMEGDPGPWLEFMAHLIPDDRDRLETMRWCATLVATEIKMTYALLLISETQGVGKSTLGERILAPLVGMHNASFPSEQMMTENKFNEWRAHKRLIVVHEIYSGHSRVTYDKLKPVVTDDNTTVDRKFMASYTIRNLAEIIAASNSLRAMYLDDDDRRWLVPRVTEQIKPHAYWVGFHAWLNSDGLAIIGWWAEEFLRTVNPVARGEHAPLTSAEQEVIEESMSEGYRIALDLGRMAIKYGEPSENQREQSVVLAVEEVRAHVASRRNMSMDDGRLEKPLLLRKALRAAGLMEPERSKNGTTPRFNIERGKSKSHVLANFRIEAGTEWPDLKPWHKKPDEVEPL